MTGKHQDFFFFFFLKIKNFFLTSLIPKKCQETKNKEREKLLKTGMKWEQNIRLLLFFRISLSKFELFYCRVSKM